MTVYVQGSMLLPEEYGGRLVPARVTALRESGVDLTLETGARITDWRQKLYDGNEAEIPPEVIRRDFVPEDSGALRARIEELESILTEN